jgi:hypothetical protein
MKYQAPYGVEDPDAPYINGNPSIGVQGSIPPAAAFEQPLRELDNFIEKSGFTPTDDDLMQIIRSVRRQFVNFAIDTGPTNALSVSLDPPLEQYYAGMPLRVMVGHNNTGPATINVNLLGPRPIKTTTGLALGADDLTAGMVAYLLDDGTAWQLISKGGTVTGSVTTVDIPYAADTGSNNNILAVYSPALSTISEGKVLALKGTYRNTGAMTFKPNALPALPLLRNDGQPFQAGDVLNNMQFLLQNHSTYYQVLQNVFSQFRIKLGADLTLYIRTDGNDNNDGSANDAAHAFKTVAAATNYAKTAFDIAGRTVTLQLGIAGSYDGNNASMGGPTGTIALRGDPANQDSYIINVNQTNGLNCDTGRTSLIGIKIVQAAAAQNTLAANAGARVLLDRVTFTHSVGSSGQNAHIRAFSGGTVEIKNNIKFTTNCGFALCADGGAIVASTPGGVLTMSGSPTFNVTALATMGGTLYFAPSLYSWAGGASGTRFAATLNSIINTFGAGANYFPGTVAGSVSSGGQYA